MGEEPLPIQFGDFTVDPADQRLHGPQGPIHIGGRAFGVLSALLNANGRLVTKDQLFDEVWEGLAVSDAALTSVIRELRIALGDRDTHGVITAVYGKGYRFNAALSESAPRHTVEPTPEELATKLAVLPFDNLSADPDMGYFSDGISEEILSVLSRGTDIPTIGKLSSFAFRGESKSKAPSELKVSHIIDGSVRKLGDEVRITAHLLDTAEDETIWSENFDAGVTDLLSTQVRIAEAIANQMQLQFTHQERGEISPEIYDLFLRASQDADKRPVSETTIAQIERVTREAPGFAPGWARLASVYAMRRMERPSEEWPRLVSEANQAIDRAISIDPNEPIALQARFQLFEPFGPTFEVTELIDRLELSIGNTSTFHFMRAWNLILLGRTRMACSHARRAAELDPENIAHSTLLGTALYYAGELDAARETLLAELEKVRSDHHILATLLSCAATLGDTQLVDHILSPEALRKHPLREYAFLESFARAYMSKDTKQHSQIAKQVRDWIVSTGRFDLASANYLATFSTAAEAYDLIESLPIKPGGKQLAASDYVANSPLFLFVKSYPAIRQDPRFAVLCARLGIAQFWVEKNVWPDCADDEDWGYDLRRECFKAVETTSVEPPLLAI